MLVFDWFKDKHKDGLYVCVEVYANKRCEFLLYNRSVAGKKLREFAKYGGPLRIHKKMEGGQALHSYFSATEEHVYIMRNMHASQSYKQKALEAYRNYEVATINNQA